MAEPSVQALAEEVLLRQLQSINGLVAADEIILPLKGFALDKEALTDLKKTIEKVQKEENPDLFVAAAVLTDWSKSNFAAQAAATVRRDYPEVMITPARRSVKAASAPSYGLPLRARSPQTTTVSDYDQLAHLLPPP